jgi:hypothetical protein
MHRRAFATLAASSLAFLIIGHPARADEYRVSGPITHDNLAIYLIHGQSAAGPVPLTLNEALAKGSVKVHETGTVNALQIENLGKDEVFVQAGDIVKGGQQDRVLSVSLMLPPKSGRLSIAAFCVEQSRWSARGREDMKTFATAAAAVPSREAKIAIRSSTVAKAAAGAAAPTSFAEPAVAQINPLSSISPQDLAALRAAGRASSNIGVTAFQGASPNPQGVVWDKVRTIQDRLSSSLGERVNALASQSSLQLALENEKLKDAQDAYLKVLQGEGEKANDVVGFVFAVNGKLNSAEVYPSNGLFRKMWPKLLKASVTEAIGHKTDDSEPVPSSDLALAFLTEAEKGKANMTSLPVSLKLDAREADKAFYFQTLRADGRWLHRSYLAK